MFETVRVLIEEPERLRKILVFIIKFILVSIFTSVLYIHVFGRYELLNFKDGKFWDDIYNFIISGRILTVLLFYLASKLILFDLMAEIPALILRCIVNWMIRDKTNFKDNMLIRFVLELFGVIQFDNKNKRATLGKNYEQFYEMLSVYENTDAKKEIHNIKNSLMSETLHSLFVFTVLYFSMLEVIHVPFITVLLLSGLLVSCLAYYGLTVIFEFFDINGGELLFGLSILHQEKLLTEFLKEHHIAIIEEHSSQFSKRVKLKEGEFNIELFPVKQKIVSHMIQRLLNRTANNSLSGAFLITDKPISATAKKLLKTERNIKVIFADSDTKLIKKLEKHFLEK